ncbi:sigma-70 family RNA polymerase sigma factor [uncultured Bacteroides sp.]|uniref:sigma-70 family RNA polymerase sigma factor n=1 Tax=uncultured Bacteroides sp. TaxID=162156 RepID=UPI00267031FF|nr:sigma-70 family RNA polymerase sigma factor [uncultured Bacteroides sp.]
MINLILWRCTKKNLSYQDVEKEYEAADLQDFIDKLINELPLRCQEIFNMSRKQNLSYKEIAQSLQISEKTVENQINTALEYLKKNLLLLIAFM